MARSISVKVPVATLVAQIEARLAEIDEKIAVYPQAMEQYQKDVKAHEAETIRIVTEALQKPGNIGQDYDSPIRITRGFGRTVDIRINPDALGIPDAPEKPQNPNERESFGRDYVTRKSLLEKNLNILRMTSQEEVSASTYGAIMEIL